MLASPGAKYKVQEPVTILESPKPWSLIALQMPGFPSKYSALSPCLGAALHHPAAEDTVFCLVRFLTLLP